MVIYDSMITGRYLTQESPRRLRAVARLHKPSAVATRSRLHPRCSCSANLGCAGSEKGLAIKIILGKCIFLEDLHMCMYAYVYMHMYMYTYTHMYMYIYIL